MKIVSEGLEIRKRLSNAGAIFGCCACITFALGFPTSLFGYLGWRGHKRAEARGVRLKESKLITATVLEEGYQNTLSSVPEYHSSGLFSEAFSNETVKLDSKYTLLVRSEDGRVLGVSIKDRNGITKESLDMLIKKGTKVQFPSINVEESSRTPYVPFIDIKGETDFSDRSVKAGTKYADRITVLE